MEQIYSKYLVNTKEMMQKAYKNKYAIGHFNINNLEWTKSLLEVANDSNTPIILAVTASAAKYMGGFKVVSAMVNALLEEIKPKIAIALHLDHGASVELAKLAINCGFSSVMYDGSNIPFEENLKNTRAIIEYAKKFNVSVEAEIGSIGGTEDNVVGFGELADPLQAKQIKELGITMLAAGIGNIHGVYPKNWKGLNFERLESISKISQLPMVLHGGSGIPKEQVIKAISLGINKINVNTECQIAFNNGLKEYYKQKLDQKAKGYDPRKILGFAAKEIKKTFIELTSWMGSNNKG